MALVVRVKVSPRKLKGVQGQKFMYYLHGLLALPRRLQEIAQKNAIKVDLGSESDTIREEQSEHSYAREGES